MNAIVIGDRYSTFQLFTTENWLHVHIPDILCKALSTSFQCIGHCYIEFWHKRRCFHDEFGMLKVA